MASTNPLSTKDTHVLSLLSLPIQLQSKPTPPQPASDDTKTSSSPPSPPFSSHLVQTELSILTPINTRSPPPSTIADAISRLSELIDENPAYASAYNNRAQAKRLLFGDDLWDEKVRDEGTWNDLTQAITLLTRPGSSSSKAPQETLQERQRRTLASAHTQRAILVYKAARNYSSSSPISSSTLPVELRGLDKEKMEEWAARDFDLGGRYGNDVAREMARATNPYAKLCGSIVGKMMRGEMQGA